MGACEEFRDWLDGTEDRSDPPPNARVHAESCASCRALLAVQEAGTAWARVVTGAPIPAPPPFETVRQAIRAGRKPRFGPVARSGIAALAAAAGVAAVVFHVATRPAGPVDDAAAPAAIPAVAREGAPILNGPVSMLPPDPRDGAAAIGRVETTDLAASLADPATGRVEISPRTRVRVSAWSLDRTVLAIESGRVEASVLHRDAGQTFEVRTEYAVVRVVGTRFVVDHRPGEATEVTGIEGEVSVETPEGAFVATVLPGRTVRLGLASSDVPPAPRLAMVAVRPPDAPQTVASHPSATLPEPPRPPDGAAADIVMQARRLLSEGRDEEAVALLRAAIERPRGPDVRLLAALGDAERLAGHLSEARAAYERALATGSMDAPEGVYLDLASLLQSGAGRPGDVARVWHEYLAAFPHGRHAGRALWDLASLADGSGRRDEASELYRKVVEHAPRSPEAVEALVKTGRRLMDRGDLDGAAAWYAARTDDRSRDLAEAAIVGLMRVRLQQGRAAEVRALGADWVRRFPVGGRGEEVRKMLEKVAVAPR